MPSSGSTWIYNVVRELHAKSGVSFESFRAENYENFHDGSETGTTSAILRGHNVDSLLFRILNLANTRFVLSFRDPRDAVVSLLQRFGQYGTQFPRAFNDISRSLAGLLSASRLSNQIAFFYEDEFMANRDTVAHLSKFLELPITDADIDAILEQFSIASIKRFTSEIGLLSKDRLFVDQSNNAMDRVTSFHKSHISDTRVGKWRDVFDLETQDALTACFSGYLGLLSRKTVGTGRQPQINVGVKSIETFTLVFDTRLFSPFDSLDHFTRRLKAKEVMGPLGIRCLEFMYLPTGRWRLDYCFPDLSDAQVHLCQNGTIMITTGLVQGEASFVLENRLHDHPYDLHVDASSLGEEIYEQSPPAVTMSATFIPD